MKKEEDIKSMLLLTKIKIDNTTYVLCSIYSPTREHKTDQNNFIKYLKDTLIPYANENILLGGDLNFYLDLKLDKRDTMFNKGDNIIYRKIIISMLDSLNLTDCFNIYIVIFRSIFISRTSIMVVFPILILL